MGFAGCWLQPEELLAKTIDDIADPDCGTGARNLWRYVKQGDMEKPTAFSAKTAAAFRFASRKGYPDGCYVARWKTA